MSTPTTYYAQQADVEAYIEGWVTDDANALARLIRRCELDVDTLLLSFGAPYSTSGLKYSLSDLTMTQAAGLTRAVCAQVEYRFTKGEAFFIEGQWEKWAGPDFSASGKLPYIGPKVTMELSRLGIARSGGWVSIPTPFIHVGDYGLSHLRAN